MKAIIRADGLYSYVYSSNRNRCRAADDMGCSSGNVTSTVRTLRCEDGVTIVAENGARFTLVIAMGMAVWI